MLISAIFSGAIVEHLTDHKDLNVFQNFWINEQAFMILFQNFINMSGCRDGAQNEQKMIIFNEENLITSILWGDHQPCKAEIHKV